MKRLKVKHNWFKESGQRLDASYYLSDGPLTKLKLKNSPYPMTTLEKESEEIFSGNIFKRSYVNSERYGWPYITGSDMNKSNINSGKFVSKKYTKQKSRLEIKKEWILITCSGTLGNTVFTNSDFEDKVATHDLIRIIPKNNKLLPGFTYAYLTSKYGNGLLTQSSYGGVVKHIEPHHIESLPIPVFPIDKQKIINSLIFNSSKLRAKAADLLKRAHYILNETVGYNKSDNTNRTKLSTILNSHQIRFESSYYVSEGYNIQEFILNTPHKRLIDVSEEIYRPGIFKRHYVEKGIEFFGGGEIMKAIPKSDKKLSIVKTKHLESLKIEEDQILVTCGGTIGQTVLANRFLQGKAASQHILRVNANGIQTGYLFAFMSSELGLKIMESYAYGSVIPQIEPHHLALLPIPILKTTTMDEIHEMIMQYKESISLSIEMELEAIDLVEKEIEEWQK